MYKIKWTISHNFNTFDSLETLQSKFKDLINAVDKLKPNYAALDTETNGLHIKNCKPFLISIAFANFETNQGISYTIERDIPHFKQLMWHIYEIFKNLERLAGHNIKFDLHMLDNINIFYPYKNITDTQIYIRLAADAKSKEEGGVPDKLKDFAAKYITPDAKFHEKLLATERETKRKINNTKLKQLLKPFGAPPPEFNVKGEKSWTMETINHFFKDKINTVDDLPDGIKQIVEEWLRTTEDPDNYELLDREKVKTYAHYDVIFTLEILYRCIPVLKARNQLDILKEEEECIMPLYKMESVGFKFNLPYALECKEKLRNYIIQRRIDLCNLAGFKLRVNERSKVLAVFDKLGLNTDITSQNIVKNLINNTEDEGAKKKQKEFFSIIKEIRTLEKWYSTYILKWINSLGNDGRVYTQFKQAGAVSGRISSDFQQFPSKPILDHEGNVLFHPRRLIMVSGGKYKSTVYIDFAAEELRFQALYTMLVSGGDLHFCRAFIPLKCHTAEGLKYDPKTMAYTWVDKKWYLDEDNTEWHPTDLHAKTAMSAFPNEPTDTEYFKNTLRKKYGKPTNFACVYGASINTLIKQFYFEPNMAKALHDGFYSAYPKIQDYANWVCKAMNQQGYIANLFGRRYYNTSGHKARNYLVQGSAADFMKIKFKEIDDFLTKNNYKTRLQMSIHDECSFEIYEGEEHIIKDLQNILQQLDGSLIPMFADVEITYTTWDEKEDYAYPEL